ncbi:hypothetical protein [Bradyrhizobium sp. BR 1433]|uniref:hypothetical protein n=1 Tax=Bradyrhizobium sp. BR 1433 TaxID=3447967 RepID=UPI003EE5E93C
MRYVIRRMVLARVPTVEITKAEYDAVKPARGVINELIAVEEKYDAVMENYVELEETVHNLGIRVLAFVHRQYEEMAAPLNLVSRRVSNLLSSTRLYRDALPQHAVRLLGRKHPAIQPLLDLKRDNPLHPLPYRQMEAVRNYAQHVGPPLNGITFDRHRDVNERDETTGFSFSIVPHMDAEAISQLRDMAPDLRTSFRDLGNQPNPVPLIRKYVEHIGAIHAGFRDTVRRLETENEAVLRSLLDRYAKVAPMREQFAVAVGVENADGAILNPEYLVEHRLEYFKYLRLKHVSIKNLAKSYVPW